MFCPKCGIENPDKGKFCRICGTDLGNISAILTGKSTIVPYTVDPRKRGVSWEFAITKTFTGLAFLLVSIILAITGKFGAENWWFWLLIPAFGSLSSGVAQIFQLRKLEKLETGFSQPQISNSATQNNVLPPVRTDYLMPPKLSIYDTEDLAVQPSVTENTTRQLELNKPD
jgi:zinc-ribbon domain